MSRFESITIREVESSDLEIFYEHQLDPEAIRMAVFVCEDPKDKAASLAKGQAEGVPAAIVALGDTFDVLLFVAGFLTYVATMAFAASLGRVQWLGRGATRAFMIVTGVALLFLLVRGLHYPDPRALSTPWYTSPGFIVGIPAVPFIMPFLFGVVLLRRAGEEQS